VALLELYHWEPGANSGEVLILLHEKGIAFRSRYVDLLQFEQLSEALIALNPRGQVPVLVHDGRVLTETTLILEYLDAVFPDPPLSPSQAADRYAMRVWTKWTDEYVAPAVSLIGWHERMAPLMKTRDVAAIRARARSLPPDRQAVLEAALNDTYTDDQLHRARTSLRVVVRRLENALTESLWLAGDHYSLADIALFPLAMSLPGLVPALVSNVTTPHLLEWLRKMRARGAVRAALDRARTPDPTSVFAPGPELPRWG
jgi:GSH-dependent disulfide-bond oxidoreductase